MWTGITAFFLAGAVVFPLVHSYYLVRVVFSLGLWGIFYGIESVLRLGAITTSGLMSGGSSQHSVRIYGFIIWIALFAFVTRRKKSRSPAEIDYSESPTMKITVETFVAAPIERVWQAYTTPSAICQWNAASDDWHTTESTVDLREGGAFSSRMEAKDGSVGFDFDGVYTQVVPHALLEYTMSERAARVEFVRQGEGVVVRVCFDADAEQSLEQQRQGWQSILENFKRHVEKAVA
ncbi:MAG: SRPBCC family protein [Burkholderiaceae bacterium]|nr:SRPBCC family protein [Burkholderiaceae bacterium]